MLLCACMHSTKEVGGVSPKKTSVVVDAEIQLDPDSNHFDYGVLIVSLYEYDQRLADVAASLVESRQAEVSYTRVRPLLFRYADQTNNQTKKRRAG